MIHCISFMMIEVVYCLRDIMLYEFNRNEIILRIFYLIDYERYCVLKDNYQLYRKFLGNYCYSCKEYSHNFE